MYLTKKKSIDDLLEAMYDALEGHHLRCEYPKAGQMVDGVIYDRLTPRPAADGRYCYAPVTHKAMLGRIVELLHIFHDQPKTLLVPQIAPGSFVKKLYSLYLSYLPRDKVTFDLKMNVDDRGSFTELLKKIDHGQISVNISKPQHYKGPALAQQQMGVVYCGERSRVDPGAQNRYGRGDRV